MKVYMYEAYGRIRYTLSNEPVHLLGGDGAVEPVEIPAEVKKLTFQQLLKLIKEMYPNKEIVYMDPKEGIIRVYYGYDSDDGDIYFEYYTSESYIIIPKDKNLPSKILLRITEINDFGTEYLVSTCCTDIPEWLDVGNW